MVESEHDNAGDGGAPGRPEAGSADVAELERRHVDELARAHAALAAAQDRSYWLDRWGVDLNALMRRPAAARMRAGLRAVREVRRTAIAARRFADARRAELRKARADDEAAGATDRAGS